MKCTGKNSKLIFLLGIFLVGCDKKECVDYNYTSHKQSKELTFTLCDASTLKSIISPKEIYNFKEVRIIQDFPRRTHNILFGVHYPLQSLVIMPLDPNKRPKTVNDIDVNNWKKMHGENMLTFNYIRKHKVGRRDYITMKDKGIINGYYIESNYVSDSLCISLITYYFPPNDSKQVISDHYHYDLLNSISVEDISPKMKK